MSLLFTIPSTLIILFFSEEIVYVVYKGGNFDDNDIIIVAKMLLIYTIALPFNVIYKIFLSCLFANGNTKSSMYISIVGLIVNVVLNFCFISIFKEFSVVFATTISSIVSFLLAIYWLKKINFLSLNMDNLKFLIKIILKSIIMCLIVKLCLICLLKINILSKLHSFNILLSFFIGGVFYLLINYKDIITIKDN